MPASALRSPYELGFRNNREPNLYDKYTTVSGSSHSQQSSRTLTTNQSSTMSSKSENQFKVSEIVNPDGSVTVRNLLINEEGIWTKQEQKIDNRRCDRLHRPSRYATRGTNFDRNDHRTQIIGTDDIPAMQPVDSFSSGSSYSSGEEAVAHRLRRQRLAHSSTKLFDPSSNSTTGSRTPERAQYEGQKVIPSLYAGGTPPPIPRSPGRPQTMNTTVYSPTYSPTNLPTNRSTTSSRRKQSRPKNSPRRVAFSEPLSFESVEDGRILKNGNYDFMKSDVLADIYSDIDVPGHRAVNQSFTSEYDGDSSIFDDLPQTSKDAYERQQSALPKRPNRISYVDNDKERPIPNLYSVTVHKISKADKIGIYVHLDDSSSYGKRLVVSQVAPDGKFANTIIKEGDVVVSINGEDMIEDPNLQRALNIVLSAIGSVTVVVHKDFEVNDSQSADQTSISSMSKDMSPVSHWRDHQQNNKDKSLFRGSERFDNADRTRRGKMTGDGSMLISKDSEHQEPFSVKLNESWKVSGVIVVSIEKKSSTLEKPGIRIGVKETSTGHVLYISDINPSSMFANTPLLIGDIIISINGINLHDNADVVDAYSALGKPGKQITLVAKKGEASLNEFLLDGRSQPPLPKDKRQGSINTSLTSLTSGTMGTSVSGESSRDMIRDCTKSYDSPLTGSRNSSQSNRTNSRTDDFEFDEEIEASKTNSEANDTNSRGPISNSGKTLHMLEEVEESQESESPATSLRLQEEMKDSKQNGKKKRQKVLITVTKRNKGQKIGIEFTLLNNKLVVSEVSPTGLLRNAPLVFGDTILSINGVSFKIDPIAKEAFSLIKNAREKVTLEILKTEYKRDVGVSNKSCMSPLFWSRRSTKL